MVKTLLIEFHKVGEFEEFLKDLAYVLNMPKVLSILSESSIKLILDNHRILLSRAEGFNSVAEREEWIIMGKKGGYLGKIVGEYIDEHFFVFGEGWRFLYDKELIELIFRIDEKYEDNKEAKNLMEEEKEKALNYAEGKTDTLTINQNIALFIKHWAIPIKPVKIELKEPLPEKFIKFMKKLSQEYENKPPLPILKEIAEKVEIMDVETYLGYEIHKVDWDKVIKTD